MDYTKTLSIHSPEQIEGWELITDAAHAKVSEISLQLWHVRRVSSAQVNGLQSIGPSSIIAKDIQVYIFGGAPNGDATMIPMDEPRSTPQKDIDQVERGIPLRCPKCRPRRQRA